jgi:hypothetical protein
MTRIFPVLMVLCFGLSCVLGWWLVSSHPTPLVASTHSSSTGHHLQKEALGKASKLIATDSADEQRSKLLRWATKASAADLCATMRGIRGLPSEIRAEVRAACMRRLCALDPKGALTFAGTAFSERDEGHALVQECLRNLVAQDPSKTVEYLQQIPWHFREKGVEVALKSLAAKDFPGRDAMATELTERLPYNKASWITQLALHDPEAARKLAMDGTGTTYERGERLSALAAGLAEVDPAAAWEALKSAEKVSGNVGYEALYILGKKDPAGVLTQMEKAREGYEYAYTESLKAWVASDPVAALTRLAQSPDPKRGHAQLAAQAIAELAKTDHAAAVAAWQSLPTGLRDDASIARNLASQLASSDPAAALAWAATLPATTAVSQESVDPFSNAVAVGNTTRQTAVDAAFASYLGSNPAQALEYWRQHPDIISNFTQVGSKFTTALLQMDGAEQKALLSQIPADQRIHLVPDYYSFDANSIPLLSSIIAEQPGKVSKGYTIPSSANNDKALGFANNWASQDPKAASEWATGLRADVPDRGWIDANVASSWAKQDAAAATSWVKSLADPVRRDFATCYLGQELCNQGQWQAAVDLAKGINNEELQQSLRQSIEKAPATVLSKAALDAALAKPTN